MSIEANPRVHEIVRQWCVGKTDLAAEVITEEFFVIPRAETCDGEVVERPGISAVSAGSGPEYAEAGIAANPNWLRNRAINLLNIADYIENREAILAAKEAARADRLDELARQFSGCATADYAGQPASTQLAILKVIELEEATK